MCWKFLSSLSAVYVVFLKADVSTVSVYNDSTGIVQSFVKSSVTVLNPSLIHLVNLFMRPPNHLLF